MRTTRCPSLGSFLAAIFAVVLVFAGNAVAVTISTDTVIGPGSPLDGDFIEVIDGDDGPTTVRIIEGAKIRGFHVFENSHVILDGGTNTFLSNVFDNARFTMHKGSMGCFADVCSVISVGGFLASLDNGQLNFFGGQFGDLFFPSVIGLLDNSTVNIYGTNFSVLGGGGGLAVLGNYSDGSMFELNFEANRSQVILHEIPEPSALTLFFSCALLGVYCAFRERYLLCSSATFGQ